MTVALFVMLQIVIHSSRQLIGLMMCAQNEAVTLSSFLQEIKLTSLINGLFCYFLLLTLLFFWLVLLHFTQLILKYNDYSHHDVYILWLDRVYYQGVAFRHIYASCSLLEDTFYAPLSPKLLCIELFSSCPYITFFNIQSKVLCLSLPHCRFPVIVPCVITGCVVAAGLY